MKESFDDINPPKWAERFFLWYCYEPLKESIQGDLYERYLEHFDRFGKSKADRLYWLNTVRFMNRHTLRRNKSSKTYNPSHMSMFKNYFKVGFRNLVKNRSFSLINILGLSVSMAICLIIILMINDQLSYDGFLENRDRIYRITHTRTNDNVGLGMATVPLPLAQTIQDEFAGAETVVRFRRGLSGEVIQNGKALSLLGYFADASFFTLFDFELESGNASTALAEPNTIVLRKDIAEKFFPNSDPVGQTLDFEELGGFTVTGVLAEFPGKSHLQFEALASYATVDNFESSGKLSAVTRNWQASSAGWVYFSVTPGTEVESLQPFLDQLASEHYDEQSEYILNFDIQKMTDITPGPMMGNQIGSSMPFFFVFGLGILAFLIIICAAFNYTNLSAARALTRMKEVGVRKVMGAKKGQLILQFVVEAVLISLVSLLVAIGLLQFLIPAFEGLRISSELNWDLKSSVGVYVQFFLFSILVGMITGIFPALYLSSFQPVRAMKKLAATNKLSKINLRKALIIMQFVISLILIVSTLLVYKQMNFMIKKDYGFNKENITNIDLQGQSFDILKNELEKLSFVERVSGANNIPAVGSHYDADVRRNREDDPINFEYFSVDDEYIDNLGLTLLAGNNFLPSDKDGPEKSIIINERAAQALGFEAYQASVGESVYLNNNDSSKVQIVGVVKDYNFMMLFMEIQPMMLRYRPSSFQWAQVKTAGQDVQQEIAQLEATWNRFDPNHAYEFISFQGQMDDFNSFFFDITYIIGLVAFLSISIASLGLLGIATYSMQIRMKEVSIRKVLGASAKGLILLLSRGFLILFAFAMLIGFTLAYLGNSLWLNEFAYRVDFGMDIFIVAAVIMLAIGFLTIGLQAFRASNSNPAGLLRDE